MAFLARLVPRRGDYVGGYNGLTRVFAVQIDLGIIDGTANKLADSVTIAAAKWRDIETGYVRNYALSIFIGVVLNSWIFGFVDVTPFPVRIDQYMEIVSWGMGKLQFAAIGRQLPVNRWRTRYEL